MQKAARLPRGGLNIGAAPLDLMSEIRSGGDISAMSMRDEELLNRRPISRSR